MLPAYKIDEPLYYDLINVKFADGYITECYRMELK